MKKFGEGQQPFHAIIDIPEGDSQELTTVTDQALNSLYGELFNLLQTHGINPTTTTSADLKQVARAVWSSVATGTFFVDSGTADIKNLTHIKGANFLFKNGNSSDNGFIIEFLNKTENTGAVTINVFDAENNQNHFNAVPLVDVNGNPLPAKILPVNSMVKAYYDYANNRFVMVGVYSQSVTDDIVFNAENIPIRNITMRTVESIDELNTLTKTNGRTVYVKSYHAGLSKGGGEFIYDASKTNINNGVTVFNGWVRNDVKFFTPEMAGAKGDGVTDDTAAVNALSLFLAQSGGGTVFFTESDKGYSIQGSLYVTTDVKIDVNNQTLIGNKTTSMFKTANVVGGNFVEITTFDPYHVIKNAKISDVKATNSAIVFDLKSFTLGCSVKNVYFDNCVQGFKLDYCFYSRWENLTATPTSGVTDKPFYHLVASSNAMIFDRVTATVAWGWLIEGGNTALSFNGCTFEGGDKGFKFKGDNLGLKFQGCYFEAITGTLFDFSEAGICVIDWNANYINGVDVIFDDGGADTTSSLFGDWESSNSIVNVGQTLGTPFTFRGLMRVSGARNNIKFFTATNKEPSNPVKDANWITGKHTNLQEFANASVDGKANIMAKADIYTGVIPVKYSGDFGTPYINQVPFTTKSTVPTSTNTSFTIDTKLVWQPLSVFAKVVLEFRRAAGGAYQIYYVYGDIYGSNIELKGGIDPSNPAQGAVTATLSNNNGYLRITFSNVQNPNGDLYVTGTVRALS